MHDLSSILTTFRKPSVYSGQMSVLPLISAASLNELFTRDFDNYRKYATLQSCFSKFFELNKSDAALSNDIYHVLFSFLTKIAEGSYGDIYKTASESISYQKFVVKSTLDDDKGKRVLQDNLLIEALMSIYLINPLREIIPNFVYTFGAFDCSGMITSLSKNPNQKYLPCTNYDPLQKKVYVLTEPVLNEDGTLAVTMSKYTDKLTLQNVRLIFAQIVSALNAADYYYEFRHNDLHSNNILIRELKTPKRVRIFIDQNRAAWITTSWVPVIIDFGWASFNFDGKPILTPSMNVASVFDKKVVYNNLEKITPFAEFYRFTIDCVMRTKPGPVRNFMMNLLRPHFDTDDEYILHDFNEDYFIYKFNSALWPDLFTNTSQFNYRYTLLQLLVEQTFPTQFPDCLNNFNDDPRYFTPLNLNTTHANDFQVMTKFVLDYIDGTVLSENKVKFIISVLQRIKAPTNPEEKQIIAYYESLMRIKDYFSGVLTTRK